MTPETALYLSKAKAVLAEADVMLNVGLFEQAGRTAYLAAFHTAQALISDRLDRSVKTHKGVQILFQDVTRNDPNLPAELRGFLSASFDMKMVADYEVEPEKRVSKAEAEVAVAMAHRFVTHFAQLLGT